MNIVEKTPGRKIDFEATQKSIIFGDDDLSINLKNREMDETVLIDVCADNNGFLVIGAAIGRRYVAQVEIPARSYVDTQKGKDSEGNPITERTPVDFDIDNCTVFLWGLEG